VDIEIDHHIMPLLNKVIQIETELRIKNRLPYTEARIAHLKQQLRKMVMDRWSDVAWNAYRDAYEHAGRYGRVFDYVEEELGAQRTKLARTTPNGLFAQIYTNLKIASADVNLAI